MYAETREANPVAPAKEFALVYRIALLKAGVEKAGINLGGNPGEVDLSLFSGTDVEGKMRNLGHINKQQRLIADAHAKCERNDDLERL